MKYIYGVILLLALIFNVLIISCQKNKECKANITVVDQNGAGVDQADVLLYATVKTSNGSTVTADLKASGKTDAGGNISFTFKLPAIYDILATKTATTTTVIGTNTTVVTVKLTGTGIIKLEEGKGVSKTVTIK